VDKHCLHAEGLHYFIWLFVRFMFVRFIFCGMKEDERQLPRVIVVCASVTRSEKDSTDDDDVFLSSLLLINFRLEKLLCNFGCNFGLLVTCCEIL
jgi:hypothetical protein